MRIVRFDFLLGAGKNTAPLPALDHQGPVAVMDARCGLCAKGARWIARNDRKNQFRIVPVQSEKGRALLTHFDIDPDDPNSWLVFYQGKAYSALEAYMKVGELLGGKWRILSALRIIPRPIRERFYSWAAHNRYKFFGGADLCNLPDAEVQRRLMS